MEIDTISGGGSNLSKFNVDDDDSPFASSTASSINNHKRRRRSNIGRRATRKNRKTKPKCDDEVYRKSRLDKDEDESFLSECKESVGRARVSNECKTDVLNSETKVQAKAMIIRQSSLRCKSKRMPSVIVANKNDKDYTYVSPIAVASNRMMVRVNNKLLKRNKKK